MIKFSTYESVVILAKDQTDPIEGIVVLERSAERAPAVGQSCGRHKIHEPYLYLRTSPSAACENTDTLRTYLHYLPRQLVRTEEC